MTSTSKSESTPSSTAKTSGGKRKKKQGLYANIQAKRRRIAAGSGETMRKPHSEGAPTDASFRKSAKTAKSAKSARKPKTTRHHRGRRAKARTGRSRSRSR